MNRVCIVDYGLGNLHSVVKSFQYLGFDVATITDASGIAEAERIVLPGVGAFADGMAGLRARGQLEPLQQFGRQQRPLLGICLGAQLLLEQSEEFGRHEGLGLIPGRVCAIPTAEVKVPHVGWAKLLTPKRDNIHKGALHDLKPGTWAYFVHSFQMSPSDPECITATCNYGPHTLVAAVQNGNVQGLQFHPEKSGESGLTMLRAFGLL